MCEVVDRHNYGDDAKAEILNKGNWFLNGNSNGRTWEWFWRGLTVLFLPWAVWITLTIIDIQTSVAVIEGNRFTSQDALRMTEMINSKADRNEVPPQWFIERVNHLQEQVERLESK